MWRHMRILSIYAKETTFSFHWSASRVNNLIIQPWPPPSKSCIIHAGTTCFVICIQLYCPVRLPIVKSTQHVICNTYILCLYVRLFPINVETAEPIGPNFFVGPHLTPGKVYEWSNFQKFATNKMRFLKIMKIHAFFFIKAAKI